MNRYRKALGLLGVVFLQLVFTSPVFALEADNLTVTAVQARTYDRTAFFATSSSPAGTCPLAGGINFRFDASTAAGKVFLSVLLTAKATGRLVKVAYVASRAPCSEATMAVAEGITVN